MDLIKSYSLVDSQEGCDLILYFEAGDLDVEFASEFGGLEKDSNLKESIMQQIAEKFPNIKINSVKIMVGAALLSSFVMASTPSVEASTSEQIAQTQSAYNYDLNFSINGKYQTFQNRAMIYNDISYVPISEFAQAINASLWANNTSNTVGITKDNINIAFVKGTTLARVNGIQTPMPISVEIGNTTYAPLKFLAENFGYAVTYNSSTRTVDISNNSSQYTVLAGDSLWTISKKFGITTASLKSANNLTSDTLQIGQTLIIPKSSVGTVPTPTINSTTYTVVSGDTLWNISQKFGISVSTLKSANNLTSDTIKIGQTLSIPNSSSSTSPNPTVTSTTYTVVAGDTLWSISQKFGISVSTLKSANSLTSDTINIGQILKIPKSTAAPSPSTSNNTSWPAVTYIVQSGDTATSISKKFGISIQDLLKYNYMDADEWFDAGDKIAISGYAPREYTVTRGQYTSPSRRGALVDWVLEGQYLVKRNDTLTIVDVDTGKQFKAKMMGGYNHMDIEPLTPSDTAVMKSLFGSWQWSPRAVVIFIDGMNIAASLSGMPHDVDTIKNNNVTGHFDLYMKNSKSHSSTTSTAYMQQHSNMVLKAAGK
ncbi:LysM peptidoglycan-binding domain-containing protein [Ruminiclostridium herbifermentans]|uniref:LysM peptidoglycan-binding domain-containing protein n=1 Tax=Ruminiclostridium herbifermentans TaxID=2488810 RepID=A0A4U7JAA0_9FIRM|nr:LysM peptidoglycan-binding domain-containing protein [Ruminiclostridium herbifermentans]QNU66753.1 LysM peptidoglycan-binding domain-containing protein [Ruminiclostridium herbifermentans]